MVFFRRSDVISTGDIFTTTGYPRFDPEQGGSVDGILDGLNRVLELAIAGENQDGRHRHRARVTAESATRPRSRTTAT